MWQKINNSDVNIYYIKYITANEIYYFYLTNFIKIWEVQISKEGLIAELKKNNPLLEASGTSLVNCSIDLLFQNVSKSTTRSIYTFEPDDKILLNIHVNNDNFTLKFPFQFVLSNSESFCEHVTLPMMSMIKALYSSKEKLMNFIMKKDNEISEYILEGAVLPDHIKPTKPFDKQQFQEANQPTLEFLDCESINVVTNTLCDVFGIVKKNETTNGSKINEIAPKKPKIRSELKQEVTIKEEVPEQNNSNNLLISTSIVQAAIKNENVSNFSNTKKNNKRKLNL